MRRHARCRAGAVCASRKRFAGIVLTQRAGALEHHAGQSIFSGGGRMEAEEARREFSVI